MIDDQDNDPRHNPEHPFNDEPPELYNVPGVTVATVQVKVSTQQVVEEMARQLLAVHERDGWNSKTMASVINTKLNNAVDEAAKQLVSNQFDSIVRMHINAAIGQVLEEGWHKTDEYGNKKGERIDLKGMIAAKLTERSDGYDRTPRIDKLTNEAIANTLNKEFKLVIDEAKARLKAAADEITGTALRDTLAKALGVRP